MDKNLFQIKKPSTKVFLSPSNTSSLETECLFGEYVKIIEKYNSWALCKLHTDGYTGWIKIKDLSKRYPSTHNVIVTRTFILNNKNIKSQSLDYIPLGARVNLLETTLDWAKIDLSAIKIGKFGFVPKNDLILNPLKIKDWINIAENLIRTPYRWGGKDTFGIDCSALVQLSLQVFNINVPRNTSDQIQSKHFYKIDFVKISRGCLIFWEGHVAIAINEDEVIHANAYHMMVVVEKLSKVLKRIGKPVGVFKLKELTL